MKKIIFILALFVSFVANAQYTPPTGYTNINSRYDWLAGVFRALGLPAGGNAAFTTGQAQRAGSVYYDSTGVDSGLHVWTGTYWRNYASETYTDADARAAISLTTTGTSGAATYIDGVFNIPNYTTTLAKESLNNYVGSRIAAWGNSLTAADYYELRLRKISGSVVFNGGINSQTSTQIKTRFIADSSKRDWSHILWMGRNNIVDASIVLADIAECVANMGHDRYIVLSVTNGGGEGVGTSNYDNIIEINDSLQSIYGERYLDVRSYLVSQYNPSLPADVFNHAEDVPPLSLRIDSIHFNQAGYNLIADYIYNNRWYILTGRDSTKYTSSAYTQLGASTWDIYKNDLKSYNAVYLRDSTSTPILINQYKYYNVSDYAASYGYGLGVQALYNNLGLADNAFGYQALYNNVGNYNNGFGHQALFNNSVGSANGFGSHTLYNNTGANSNGFGTSALYGNTGANANGMGTSALYANTGAQVNAIGYNGLYSNTGSNVNGMGTQVLYSNTGSNVNAIGYQAMYSNTGPNANSMGTQAMQFNTGQYAGGIGQEVLRYNVSANTNGFGYQSLLYNNWPNRTAYGHQSGLTFTENGSTTKSFTDAEVNAATDDITITSHGFGTTGQKVNLKFAVTSGTPPAGLVNGTVYQCTIVSSSVIDVPVTSSGSGTFTFTKDVDRTGSIELGYQANATKANQFVLPDAVINARWRGIDYTFPSAQAAAADYVLVNDGSGGLSWAAQSGSGGGTDDSAYHRMESVNDTTVVFHSNIAADTLVIRAGSSGGGSGGSTGLITHNWFDDDLTIDGVTTKINRADFFDDMLTTPTSTAGTSYMLEFVSGAAADASIGGSSTAPPDGNGWSVFTTGSTNAGIASLGSTSVSTAKNKVDTTKAYRFETKLRIETLSDDTEDFRINAGFCLYNTNVSGANLIYFRYNDNTNSGNWTCYSSDGSTTQSTNSAVAAAAGTNVILGFEYDNATIKYYINGSLVATHSTNLPVHDAFTNFPVLAVTKTAGTTARQVFFDYVKYRKL